MKPGGDHEADDADDVADVEDFVVFSPDWADGEGYQSCQEDVGLRREGNMFSTRV